MKKKFLTFILLAMCIISLSACGKTNVDLSNHLIEKRNTLFTAHDNLYCVTLSGGLREENYALDGKINPMVDFAVLTLARHDGNALANDTYTYIVTINENTFTGNLNKSETNNTYSADLEVNIPADATINVQIGFTGYSFNKDMENTSSKFAVDTNTALNIANKNLKTELENLTAIKNNKIEVVMKLLKDHSSAENSTYYWYIGVIATNGETLGILIDANSGDIIAKKV